MTKDRRLRALEDRAEIEAQILRMVWARDEGDLDLLSGLITDDFVYVSPGRDTADAERHELRGRQAFMAAMGRGPGGALVHHHSTLLIEIDGDEASAKAYQLAARAGMERDSAPRIGLKITYLLRRTVDGWRICRREADAKWKDGDPRMS